MLDTVSIVSSLLESREFDPGQGTGLALRYDHLMQSQMKGD